MPGGEDQDLESSKCTGCGELPEGKVFQCVDGHILCDQCFSVNRPCRVCGKLFPCEIRNTALEDILDAKELDCEHKWNGCEMRFNRKEIRAHVETCIFRQCLPLCSQMGLDCHYQIPRDDIQSVIDHFQECHQFQEFPLGTPITFILQDFEKAAKLPTTTKSIWPPLLVKSTTGVGSPPTLLSTPLFTVLCVSTTTIPSNNSLSVNAISLMDFFPVGGPREAQARAQFSINCSDDGGGGRVANLSWTVVPFPSMKSKELVSTNMSPFRFPIPLLLSRYMGSDGSLKIETTITINGLELELVSESSIISIPVERVSGGGRAQVGGDDDLVEQLLRPASTTPTGSSAGRRGRARGARATTLRGRRARGRGNVTPVGSQQHQRRASVPGSSGSGFS